MVFSEKKRFALILFSCLVVTTLIISLTATSKNNNLKEGQAVVSGIAGGTNVERPDVFPFYVYILGDAACGGTLIAPDMVLTAGQCLNVIDIGDSVIVNAYSRSFHPNQITRTVVETIIHPSYDFPYYDFALIRLDNPVLEVYPVSINVERNYPVPNDPLRVIGLGELDESNGSLPDILQEADVFAVANNICQSAYAGDVIDSIMLCAGVPQGGKDACDGDAGGPLLDQNGVQVGVVSAGSGCARPGYPGIYSRVSYAAGWIVENICDKSMSAPDFCTAASDRVFTENSDGIVIATTSSSSPPTDMEFETFSPEISQSISGQGSEQGG